MKMMMSMILKTRHERNWPDPGSLLYPTLNGTFQFTIKLIFHVQNSDNNINDNYYDYYDHYCYIVFSSKRN